MACTLPATKGEVVGMSFKASLLLLDQRGEVFTRTTPEAVEAGVEEVALKVLEAANLPGTATV